jgi:spore maturation protein CgeB
MRILMVHPGCSFSVSDVHNGWLEAFQGLGVEVETLNLDKRLAFYHSAGAMSPDGEFVKLLSPEAAARLCAKGVEAACFEMWPDILFVTSCFYVHTDILDLVRARGIKVVVLHTEQPYETDRELSLAAHADLNLLNDPINIDLFRTVAPTIYMPHAYRPGVHRPGPPVPSMRADFCFVGTGFPSRIKFLEQVDWSGVDVALGGMWQSLSESSPLRKFVAHDIADCMDNTETIDAYRSARIGANLYRVEGDRSVGAGWSIGPREVEMAAVGLFFLRSPRGEGDEVLSMLPRFTEPAEMGAMIRYYLARDGARDSLSGAARAAIADRTFAANARKLLSALS